MRKSQNLVLFLQIYFDLSLSLYFSFAFLVYQQFCCRLYRPSFAWTCGWLTCQERGKFNLQSVVCTNSKIGSGFFPQNVTFFMSIILAGLIRISKTRYHWKDLSLKKFMFINLYPVSRGPSIFLDKQGRVKKRYVTRQNWNNTRASNESSFEMQKPSLESPETSIFYIRHSKGFRETIYFSRNITMTTLTYSKSTDQQHLCGKFLGDKKGLTKGFYLEVWKIKSVFLQQVHLLNYQLRTVYIFVKVCIYKHRM